MVKYRTEISDH